MTTPTSDCPLKLGGVHEISQTLGVPTTNVTTWMSRRYQNGFPQPVKELAMGGVYDLDAVKAWHDAFTNKPRGKVKPASTPADAAAGMVE